jgi:MoaA/NifB/PqqE/SkfB family radical SAM enzyme
MFRGLRDISKLKGRCGRCEYAATCGGSRSRAFAATGDLYAEEPLCNYEPGSFPFEDAIEELVRR